MRQQIWKQASLSQRIRRRRPTTLSIREPLLIYRGPPGPSAASLNLVLLSPILRHPTTTGRAAERRREPASRAERPRFRREDGEGSHQARQLHHLPQGKAGALRHRRRHLRECSPSPSSLLFRLAFPRNRLLQPPGHCIGSAVFNLYFILSCRPGEVEIRNTTGCMAHGRANVKSVLFLLVVVSSDDSTSWSIY